MKYFLNKFTDILFDTFLKLDLSISKEDIISGVEVEAKEGDLAFPCFKFAKILKKSPVMIAKEIKDNLLDYNEYFEKIENKGAYLNAYIKNEALISYFKEEFDKCKILKPYPKLNKNISIDFSSPNIAKPIAFHHIRSTVIGNAISNLFEFVGYDLKRINYLGDWGTQFGKLIMAFKLWGDEKRLEKEGIKYLLELYIKYHEEAKKDTSLDENARAWFKKCEDKNEEALKLWEKFRNISIKEFKRIYSLLNIEFSHWEGESRYKDSLQDTIELIKSKVETKVSQGALIIEFEDESPVLLQKMDGATLYATRDIAAAIDRQERFDFERNLYVVGSQQKLYFSQLKKVLKMMGYDWSQKIKHIDFGMVKGMSTRKGNLVFLEDVLKEAISLAKEKILEKNKVDEKDIDEVARKVGVGAIIFGDLKNSRTNDFEFNWDEILNFSGYSGPYVQYSYTRILSILNKSNIKEFKNANLELLTEKEEIELIKMLLNFPRVIEKSVRDDELYHIAKYSYLLSKLFSSFHKNIKVLSSENELQKSRLYLLDKIAKTIKTSLSILGIETVKNM